MNKPSSVTFRPTHLIFLAVLMVIMIGALGVNSLYRRGANNETTPTKQLAEQPIMPTATMMATPTLISTPTLLPEPPASLTPIPLENPLPLATTTESTSQTAAHPPTPPVTPVGSSDALEAALHRLTLEQKIGQMLMIGLSGQQVSGLTYHHIVNQHVGGFIFLGHNTAGPEQVRSFTTDLQRIALEEGAGIPLFLAWNEEGGTVSRRLAGMTHFPSSMALGSVNDPGLVYAIGRAVGLEMLSLGLNMNYAPVLDVNNHPANPVIGLRAFGEEPERVGRLGQQYIIGLQESGVIAVAKHFPGHGGVDIDSHVALPRLESSAEQLWQTELPPFALALQTGVAAVMVAHLQVPALDASDTPASLSRAVITDLLRREMGFAGLVMTDDMGMAAIGNHYDLAQAAVMAVQAGNDLLLTVNTAHPEIIINALRDAVQAGLISEAQIDASVRRILQLKLGLVGVMDGERPLLTNRAENRELALEAGRRAVRLSQDLPGWLPLQLPDQNLVVISPLQLNPGPQLYNGYTLLGENLLASGLSVEELLYDPRNPASVSQAQAAALNRAPDAYVVVTWDAILRQAQTGDTSQEEMVTALLATGRPVIVVFGSLPYDQTRMANAPTQMMMFGDTDGQIEGIVTLLLGP